MSKVGCTLECLEEGFSCAQSVFSTYCRDYGIDRITGLRISGTLGGGICNMGETCGAIVAADMLIGLKYGRIAADDMMAKERSYGLSRDIAKRFKEKHGSIKCKELLGFDINTEEGAAQAAENNVFKLLCPQYVKSAAEIYEQIILAELEKDSKK